MVVTTPCFSASLHVRSFVAILFGVGCIALVHVSMVSVLQMESWVGEGFIASTSGSGRSSAEYALLVDVDGIQEVDS